MDTDTEKLVAELYAELAEKEAEIQSLADELAYMMSENKALRGQLALVKQDCRYEA